MQRGRVEVRIRVITAIVLLTLLSSFALPGKAIAQNKVGEVDANVIHFFAGFENDKEKAPRLFGYPLYLIHQGEQITWQNDDTRIHQLKVTKEPAISSTTDDNNSSIDTVFESQNIHPMGNASFTFNNAGSYTVQSVSDPSLIGKIVVADKITTVISRNSTKNGVVDVALSWYPEKPRAGETTFFKIEFLDKEAERHHDHIDYTFAIQNTDGIEVDKSLGLIHSGEGKEFTFFTFQSQGNFTAIVSLLGVNFVPIARDEVKFNVPVTG